MTADMQRYGLLAALFVLGYLLILAWNDDYGSQPADSAALADADPLAVDVAPAPSSSVDAPTIPSVEQESSVEAGDDVPSDVAAPEQAPPADAPAAGLRAEEGLVRVRTDTLNLWIDRRGGDIVKLTLPTYPQDIETPDAAFVLLDRTPSFTYIAQSGLTGADGIDNAAGRALFGTAADEFVLADGEDELEVVLETSSGEASVEKIFTFRRGDHRFDVRYRIRNRSDRPLAMTPYAQFKRDAGDPPGAESSGLGPQPYIGPAFTTVDTRYLKLDFDDIEDEPFQEDVDGGWVAMLQHYFLSAWVPDGDERHRYYARQARDGTFLSGFAGPGLQVAPGGEAEVTMAFYAGPKIQKDLEAIAEHLNLTVDYGFLWWLANPLFDLLSFFHDLTGNWGFAIILLTLAVKTALYPLSAAGYRSMANMRRVAPELKRLQDRYGDDRQKLSKEMMELYRKEKINPLGGCLPMVLQMPVFLALYWVLYESVELRQAPFILWIEDMSKMDPFFVLPLLMGATMFFQMKLNPAPPDPMQARVMQIMPVMFTVLFLFFPAGLVLYWLMNSVLSIAQQWYITRKIEQGARAA